MTTIKRLDGLGYSYSIVFERAHGLPIFVGRLYYGGFEIAVTQGFSHEGCSTQLMAIYRKRKRKVYNAEVTTATRTGTTAK